MASTLGASPDEIAACSIQVIGMKILLWPRNQLPATLVYLLGTVGRGVIMIASANSAGWTDPASRSITRQALSDEALMRRIAGQDKLAMRIFFARHQVRLYRFVLRLVRDEALSEDLVSDVFLDVWRQAGEYEARATVSTWLLAIARYKAISALRRRRELELDAETASAIVDPADDPEMTLQEKDRHEALRRGLAKLSPEHREIIDLVYYHEKPVKEVAEIVGIPEPTVKTRMFYARKKLSWQKQRRGNPHGASGIHPTEKG